MSAVVLTVRQLNSYVKSLIEGDTKLFGISITGEISNLKDHYASGHLYFTLKDSDAAINCVMFRSSASRLKFRPENGQKVILRGRVSIYEKDGQYQFYAEDMIPDGIGDIALRFEQIKDRLQKEGLFDTESKRPIPKFPKKIAVVTSASGAAVRDIMNVISRRWNLCELVMCPVSVQGENAVPEMLAALDRLYTLSDIDLCIIGRGGGSIEDLWAFNSEELARKIYESPFPVISAVGHETDFTICDFVADLRAPTPSAAAELAVPDKTEIYSKINRLEETLRSALRKKYDTCLLKLESYASRAVFKTPRDVIINKRLQDIDRLYDRINIVTKGGFNDAELRFSKAAAQLDALSPLKTLSRGFAVVQNKERAVTSVKDIKKDDLIKLRFADGIADCRVEGVSNE